MKVSGFLLRDYDVLDRIQYFLHLKHWSLYKLVKEADLPYSSLNDFFAYKINPLKSNTLTDVEQDLINCYRTLSNRDKELLTDYLNGLCKR